MKMMILALTFVAVGALLLPAHSNHLPTKSNKPSSMICSLKIGTDTARSGLPAIGYFVPKGWNSDCSITWDGDTATVHIQSVTQDKSCLVNTTTIFGTTYSVQFGQTKGQRLNGSLDYLHSLLDHLRGAQGISQVQVVSEKKIDLPLSPGAQGFPNINPGAYSHPFHDSALIKTEFQLNGVEQVAYLHTRVEGNNTGSGGLYPSQFGYYNIGPTMLIVTPLSVSPERVKEIQVLCNSAVPTEKFWEFCIQVVDQRLKSDAEATRRRGAEMAEEAEASRMRNNEEFRKRMDDRDAASHDFLNYIKDQQDYKDSSGRIVTVPYEYDHCYEDGQGNYILNSDPTLDPTKIAPGNWQLMAKAVRGN